MIESSEFYKKKFFLFTIENFRYVQAILGMNRPAFECKTGDKDMEDLAFCLFKNPSKFLKDVVKMKEDQFWNDVTALFYTIVIMRIAAFVLLRWKLMASR